MFLFLLCYTLNKLDPSILVWERETHSAFLCEYSYSSPISVEYSCLATAMLSTLFFMHLLSELLFFCVRKYSLVSLLNLIESFMFK